MPNGTGISRNFQISGKKDNLWRLSKIFEMSFQKRSVPFDFVPEFPEILVQWIAPYKIAVFSDFFCGIAVFIDFFCGNAVFSSPQCPPPIVISTCRVSGL